MAKVFVSSVVGGMGEFRKAAKEAIVTMDHTPVMCEDFAARPYSSEQACSHEVEQSDIYLVILGKDYGFETPDGISVTQAEFRAAKGTDKPILAFIQRVDERDERQKAFLQEVEAYQSGVFRGSFETPLELNNEIIKALRELETMSQAVTEDDFETRVTRVLKAGETYSDGPELMLAYLPQPKRTVDIVSIEQNMGSYFNLLCQAEVTRLRDGYKLLDHAHWTGFISGSYSLYICPDGLTLLRCDPTSSDEGLFSSSFVPPDRITKVAKGFRSVMNVRSAYVQLSLRGMENAYVANPPQGNSMTMRMFGGEKKESFNHLFVPLTEGNYNQWVDQCVSRLSRIFRYKNE